MILPLYLGKHHLIDVEGLVDDSDLLAGLLFIPFREVGKSVFIYVISPVVNLQNLLTVLFVNRKRAAESSAG